jgi:hypothetical protein
MGVKEKPDIIERKRLQWYGHVKRMQEERETTKINYGVDTRGKKKKRTSKKNVDGRRTSSHGNKTFRSISVVKQKGMVFGFRKMATAVVGPEREREREGWTDGRTGVWLGGRVGGWAEGWMDGWIDYATNLYLQYVLEMMSIYFSALIDTFHHVPRNFS